MILPLIVLLLLGAALVVWRRRRTRKRPRRWGAVAGVAGLLAIQLLVTAPPAAAAACGEPPTAQTPGVGLVGLLDPATGRGIPGTAYGKYGYAGLVWFDYTTDCGPLAALNDSVFQFDAVGDGAFNAAKNIVGITNSLHYQVMDGVSPLTPLYDAVKKAAEHLYFKVFSELFAIAALLVVIVMARHIWKGDFSAVAARGLHTLAGTWLAASSITLLLWLDPIDQMIVSTTSDIQAGILGAGQDPSFRDQLPTDLHTQIVYNNWLRGEIGGSPTPQDTELGPRLLAAQALTKEEALNSDEVQRQIREGKKTDFTKVADLIGRGKDTFSGEDGTRTGTGFLALGQSLIYCPFPMLAKASIIIAQTLLRLIVIGAPLIGLLAVFRRDTLRTVVHGIGTVGFHVIVISALAGVHALVMRAVFAAELGLLANMGIGLALTIALFRIGRPVHRLRTILTVSARTVFAPRTLQTGLVTGFRPTAENVPGQNAHIDGQPRAEAIDVPDPRDGTNPHYGAGRSGDAKATGAGGPTAGHQMATARASGSAYASSGGSSGTGGGPPPWRPGPGIGGNGPPPEKWYPPPGKEHLYIKGRGHTYFHVEATNRVQELPERRPAGDPLTGRGDRTSAITLLPPRAGYIQSGEDGFKPGRPRRHPNAEKTLYEKSLALVGSLDVPDKFRNAWNSRASHAEIKQLTDVVERYKDLPWEHRPHVIPIVVNHAPCRGCLAVMTAVSIKLRYDIQIYATHSSPYLDSGKKLGEPYRRKIDWREELRKRSQ